MVTTTADPAAGARAIMRAQTRLLHLPPDPAPPAPVHVVTLPLLLLHHAETLEPSPRLLLLHLWTVARAVTKQPIPSWFWHTDRQWTRETGLSPRTLARARRVLEDRRLLLITDNQGQGKRETWYAPVWPPPPPPATHTYRLQVYADELAASGHPPSRLVMWTRLARAADCHPTARALALDLAATPAAPPEIRLRLAARLREADPWLARQLIWADADLYQTAVRCPTSILSGQLPLPSILATASPSA